MTRHWFGNDGRGRIKMQAAFLRKMARVMGDRDVGGLCEIGEGDGNVNEPKIVRNEWDDKDGWMIYGLRTHVPIIINKRRREILDKRTIFAAPGKPGVGPHRYINTVGWRNRPFRLKHARVNTHTHAGAWNQQFNRHDDWRKEQWRQHWKKLQAEVDRLIRLGYCVTVTGDMNRPGIDAAGARYAKPHPDAVLIRKVSTDEIWAIAPKGRRVKRGRYRRHKGGVDFHDIHAVNVTFPKTRKSKKKGRSR